MPAQALIRHLSKLVIQDVITKNRFDELLEVKERPDGSFLVVCKPAGEGSVTNAPEALQVLADLDAAEVRKKEAAEKKKAEEEAAKQKQDKPA